MSEQLKPCPFCGGREASVCERDNLHFVMCDNCTAEGPAIEGEQSRIDAAREWNRRTAPVSAPLDTQALPPIERDEQMDRTYIPLPGGWEIQTKGKGSTFRIAHVPASTRWMVLADELHEPLEAMARDTRNLIEQHAERIRHLERELAERRPRVALDPELKAALNEAAKTRAAGAILPDGSAVFINYGDQPEDNSHLCCTACGGSGHIEDQQDIASRAERKPASIDTPEFRQMLRDYRGTVGLIAALRELNKLIAYIDGRTAGTASDGWKVLSEGDKPDASRRLDVILKNGVLLEGAQYSRIDWTQVADWRYSAAAPTPINSGMEEA